MVWMEVLFLAARSGLVAATAPIGVLELDLALLLAAGVRPGVVGLMVPRTRLVLVESSDSVVVGLLELDLALLIMAAVGSGCVVWVVLTACLGTAVTDGTTHVGGLVLDPALLLLARSKDA